MPATAGAQAALEIAEEFEQRTWHQNVTCQWDGCSLVLQAENDFDDDGRALSDEFSDAISASVSEPFDGDIRIVSVTKIS